MDGQERDVNKQRQWRAAVASTTLNREMLLLQQLLHCDKPTTQHASVLLTLLNEGQQQEQRAKLLYSDNIQQQEAFLMLHLYAKRADPLLLGWQTFRLRCIDCFGREHQFPVNINYLHVESTSINRSWMVRLSPWINRTSMTQVSWEKAKREPEWRHLMETSRVFV